MCLLVLAWQVDRAMPLLLAGNRDERHARPSAALDWWADRDWVGGRDLVAGGTWLAAARDGRFAVVTNYPKLGAPANARSRGHLVPEYLDSGLEPLAYLARVAGDRRHYAGFSLIVGDDDTVGYYGNAHDEPRRLAPGYYGLGNDGLDCPSPRLQRARARVEAMMASGKHDEAALFALWAERPRDPGDDAPFIVGGTYGTRATTILSRGTAGLSIAEVCYGADGEAGERRAFRWNPAA